MAAPYVNIPQWGQGGHNSGTAFVAVEPIGGVWRSVPDPVVAGLVQLQTTQQDPGPLEDDDPAEDYAEAEISETTTLVVYIDVHILLNINVPDPAQANAMGICVWSADEVP